MLYKDVRQERRQLSNGIPVFFVDSPHTGSLSVYARFGVGSAAEDASNYGAAHALEHAMFLGTEGRSNKEIRNAHYEWNGAGGAYTSHNETVFHCTSNLGFADQPRSQFAAAVLRSRPKYDRNLLLKRAGSMISHLGDMLTRPVFPADKVASELKLIANEHGWRLDSNYHLFDEYLPLLRSSPYNRNIGGSRDNVKNLNRAKLVGFRYEHMHAGNLSFYISGPLGDIAMYLEMLERWFSALPRLAPFQNPAGSYVPQDLRALMPHRHQNESVLVFGQSLSRTPEMSLYRDMARYLAYEGISAAMRDIHPGSYTYGTGFNVHGETPLCYFQAYADPDETHDCVSTLIGELQKATTVQEQPFEQLKQKNVRSWQVEFPQNSEWLIRTAMMCETDLGGFDHMMDYSRLAADVDHRTLLRVAGGLLDSPVGSICLGPKPDEMPCLSEIRDRLGIKREAQRPAIAPRP